MTRNFANNYTKFDQGDLALIPDVAWDQFLGAFGLPEPGYLVSVATPFFEKLGPFSIFRWQTGSFIEMVVLNPQASRLTRALDDRNFEFYGKALRGSEEQQPDWNEPLALLTPGWESWWARYMSRSIFRLKQKNAWTCWSPIW